MSGLLRVGWSPGPRRRLIRAGPVAVDQPLVGFAEQPHAGGLTLSRERLVAHVGLLSHALDLHRLLEERDGLTDRNPRVHLEPATELLRCRGEQLRAESL